MRILVTGATGFIGSHLVRAFAGEGHVVFAASRNLANDREEGGGQIRRLELDLKSSVDVRSALLDIRPELTVHLAWCTQPEKYWTTPENLDHVEASLGLARGLREVGCPRLVVAGSCAEYDWDYGFLSEDSTPLRPRTLYGACKNGLREILEAYSLNQPMQLAWTRLFYLFGPGERPERLLPSIVARLLRGEMARCTRGEGVRDFLHVEDAASAIVAVSMNDFTGAINIGSGQPVTIRAMVEMIAAAAGARDGIAFGALPERAAEPPRLVADVRKLASRIGWRPKHGLEQGVLETVNWWKAKVTTGRNLV